MPTPTTTVTTRSAERAQFLADVLIGAIEGGTGYWAVVHRYKWCTTDNKELPPEGVHAVIQVEADGGHEDKLRELMDLFEAEHGRRRASALELVAFEDGLGDDHERVLHKLDVDVIAKGIARIRQDEVQLRADIRKAILHADIDNDADIDADGADAIVQAALFGELVFG